MSGPRFLAVVTIVVFVAALRLAAIQVPLPGSEGGVNFAPIGAMAIFCGLMLRNRWLAIGLPLGSTLLSDLALGVQNGDMQTYLLNPVMLFVYAGWCLYVFCGMSVRRLWSRFPSSTTGRILSLGGGSLAGSVVFFLVSNFGVWCLSGWYPRTLTGLTECFVAAVPYFRGTLQGDAVYLLGLMGLFAAVKAVTVSDQRSTAIIHAN